MIDVREHIASLFIDIQKHDTAGSFVGLVLTDIGLELCLGYKGSDGQNYLQNTADCKRIKQFLAWLPVPSLSHFKKALPQYADVLPEDAPEDTR